MRYDFDFSVIARHWTDLAFGLLMTVQLSAVAMFMALVLAVVVVLGKMSRYRASRWAATIFVDVTRNTPFLVQIFFIFFGLPQFGVRLTPYTAAVLALSINGAAYCAEIIRGGVQAIQRGQIDAALALGLSPLQVFRYVVLRPALKSVYPALSSQFILIMLLTSVTSTISTLELTLVGLQLESVTFRSFEIFGVITLIYLAASLVLSAILARIGRVFFSYPNK